MEAQKAWVEHIKQKLEAQKPTERIAFFDEFAVYDRPSLFYGWAERNTRPEIPLPLGMTLADIECKLKEFLASHQFLSAEQVQKTLNHIFSLVA